MAFLLFFMYNTNTNKVLHVMYSICCQMFFYYENRYSHAFTVDEGSAIVIKL